MKTIAVARLLIGLTLLGGSSPAVGQNVKPAPTPTRSAQEPNLGLQSVALRADEIWQGAHAKFRKVMTDTADRCDPVLKQTIGTTQVALKERTRAWTDFYERRRLDSEEMKKGYATVIADIDGQIRTEESGLGRLIEMADELTRRLNNLKLGSAGLDPQDVAKAEESLNEQLKVRRGAIEASRKMIEQYKEILRIYTAEQSSGTDDAGVAAAFKDLIRSQNGLYESIYRSQELRLSLDCRPARVTGPPAVPEI